MDLAHSERRKGKATGGCSRPDGSAHRYQRPSCLVDRIDRNVVRKCVHHIGETRCFSRCGRGGLSLAIRTTRQEKGPSPTSIPKNLARTRPHALSLRITVSRSLTFRYPPTRSSVCVGFSPLSLRNLHIVAAPASSGTSRRETFIDLLVLQD